MAMPTIVAVGTVASGQSNVSPALPTGWAADDIHVLFIENQDTLAVPAMTGWTEIAAVFVSTGSVTRLTVRWRRAVGPYSGGSGAASAGLRLGSAIPRCRPVPRWPPSHCRHSRPAPAFMRRCTRLPA